ncbi:MAG: response regulator, partial [Desulfuromonas sp.]
RHKHSVILQDLGHETVQACDGLEGLNRVMEHQFDLALVDLMMPNLDGIGFLAALNEKGVKIPVIVISADIQETKREECAAQGAVAFIDKPAKKEKLVRLLSDLLDQ